MGREHKFKKNFTPEQYEAYLLRKAKSPNALIQEEQEKWVKKFKPKKKIG